MSDAPKTFPIMPVRGEYALDIPWSMIEPFERQAVANHGQTLKRLAERGGLSASEAYAVMNGLGLSAVLKARPSFAHRWLAEKAAEHSVDERRTSMCDLFGSVERLERELKQQVETARSLVSAYDDTRKKNGELLIENSRLRAELASALAALAAERGKALRQVEPAAEKSASPRQAGL